MKNILSTFLLMLAFLAGYSQMNNNGGNITVQTGATLVIQGDYTCSNGGNLDIDGTVELRGDYVNNVGTIDPTSTGTMKFNGTASQDIGGTVSTTFYCDVVINNASGVTLLGYDQTILGDLTFTSGILTMGAYNLTLGPSSTMTRTAGHACATGTGEFRKQFSSVSTFTMPIGDATRYTPVTVAFNSGTFGGSAYVGSRVTASAHPSLPTTTDYISRYWSMSSSNITNIDCNLTFNFDATDIVGTPANYYCTKYLGSGSWKSYNAYVSGNQLTASNATGFSDWSGSGKIATTVALKTYLAGPFNTGTGEMSTTLNSSLQLPLNQPYNNNPSAPWYYTGTESVGSIPNANIVDWVLVEFRHASTPANATSGTKIGRAAGFLKKDGSIVGLDGSSNLKVDGVSPYSDNLYAVVYHRNHLAVMAGNPVTDGNSDGVFDYDYSTGSGVYGTNPMRNMGGTPNKWALWSGDADANGIIEYARPTSDITPISGAVLNDPGNQPQQFTNYPVNNVYNLADVDMNGIIEYARPTSDITPISGSVLNHPANQPQQFTNYAVTQQLP
jgi:hypothetical protein